MKLSERQKSLIVNFLHSGAWQVIEGMMADYQDRVRKASTVKETSDETLKATYSNDGKIKAISEFKQELINKLK